jgi:primosomal protein N' (replication factor Y)
MRWDPVWFADRELEERLQLGLPPSQSFASIVGRRRAVASALADLRLPEQAKVLGPLPTGVEEEVRALVTVPRAQEGLVAAELAAARALASARKEADGIRIRVGLLDPLS